MPAQPERTEEQAFSEAFNDAAKARPAEQAEPAPAKAESEVQAEDKAQKQQTQIPEPHHAPEGQDAPGTGDHGHEPDYKALFEREVQRFKSFEGRYRKEKQAWERERRELMELMQRETGTAQSPAGDEQVSTDNVEDAAAPSITEAVRTETMRLMQPILAGLEAERHRSAMAAAHPDFESLADDPDLHAWIDEQPGYIARSLRQVADHGSAGEVIDLLDRYKRDRGRSAAKARAQEDKAQAERKAQQATAVRSKSAGPPKEQPSADDFAGAWAEAVRKSA